MKNRKRITDIKQTVKQERKWAEIAARDAVEDKTRAKKLRKAGKTELAKDTMWDAKVSKSFAIIRKKRAKKEAKKLK